MSAPALTHTGVVVNHNYGKPYRTPVKLRESAKYWISEGGTKYRKTTGDPAGATVWTQTRLQLESIAEEKQ